jgi:hypothetical protein
VEVSSGDDDVSKPNASSGKQKKLAGDDAKDEGVSSVEPITPKRSVLARRDNPILLPLPRLLPSISPLASVGVSLLRQLPSAIGRWIR